MATGRRTGGRGAKREERAKAGASSGPHVWNGGQYRPLSERDVDRIVDTALAVLSGIGMQTDHANLIRLACERGATLNEHERLCFPRSMVEDMIAGAARTVTLHEIDPQFDLELRGERVHFATNGQTPSVAQYPSGEIRPAELLDVYDFARLGDYCGNVHQFTQPDIAWSYEANTCSHQDINVCYALLSGTRKHVGQAITDAAQVCPTWPRSPMPSPAARRPSARGHSCL